MLVLCGAIFLEGVDISMMGVALPAIRADLGLSTAALQWVVSGYVLGYGGFVLLGGRAADLLGRRRMFIGWLGVFIAFSGLGGLATEGWMLILARFATGVAAAFLAPAGLSIITTTFPEGAARDRAVLVYAGAAAGGFSLGMVVGGLLTSVDWRWVFFAPVVMASLLLAAALPLVPRDVPAAGGRARFDVPGTLALTGAMLLLVVAVVHLPEVAAWVTAATLAGSAALFAAFVAVQRRSPAPLMRLGILRSRPLLRANIGAFLLVAGFMGFQFVAVLYLQELRGWSEIETGLALAVIGIDAVIAPTLTPRLVARYGNQRVIAVGLVLVALAFAWFLPLGMTWSFLTLLPGLLAIGFGFALAYGPLTIAATDDVDAEEQGLASGILTTSFQFGSALGLAVTTAVVVAAAGSGTTLDSYRAGLLVPVAALVIASLVTVAGLRRRGSAAPVEELARAH
ncbi:MFS transporter [Asanoa iriomotensis]|uniref:MFS transporter n=1 Tax=Asanoa iriomotensis TaxID=234613 RepID=A0ABQ4C185_9ACTN|nr:MFS transporter [Asanoa iriomotensis]